MAQLYHVSFSIGLLLVIVAAHETLSRWVGVVHRTQGPLFPRGRNATLGDLFFPFGMEYEATSPLWHTLRPLPIALGASRYCWSALTLGIGRGRDLATAPGIAATRRAMQARAHRRRKQPHSDGRANAARVSRLLSLHKNLYKFRSSNSAIDAAKANTIKSRDIRLTATQRRPAPARCHAETYGHGGD